MGGLVLSIRQYIDFRLGQIPRIRYTREGYDAWDMSLGNEAVTFDSAWPEILAVHDGSWSSSFVLTGSAGTEAQVRDRYRDFAGLPFSPVAVAWRRQANGIVTWYEQVSGNVWSIIATENGGPAYRGVPCATSASRLTIRDRGDYAGTDYAYMVFASPRGGTADSREILGSGLKQIHCGWHPTRGMGLFVARNGADVMTCPDHDLRINTGKPILQIAAAGNYTAQQRVVNKVGTTQYWGMCNYVDLADSMPDRPPVLVSYYTTGLRPDDRSFTRVVWLSDTRFVIYIGDWQNRDSAVSANIRWWIPRFKAGALGVDTPGLLRVFGSSSGLEISEPGVDNRFATPAQRLFDSNRSMVHIYHRATSSGVGAGAVTYSSKATGPPLAIIDHYMAGGNVMSVGQGGISGGSAIYTTGTGSLGYTNSPGGFSVSIIDFSKYI